MIDDSTPSSLDGVRVVDLTRVLAGPWCTQILADLGADVIKVERPRSADHSGGDDTRGWGPPYLRDSEGNETQEAAYFQTANRNKRSVTIDIAQPLGQDLLRQLVTTADVVVDNFKVGDMARYGLDGPAMLKLNPRAIVCSITGFGQTGPYRHRPGYDYVIQGLGGLMSITGPSRDEISDDEPGGGPQKAGVAVADLFTGMYAATAILAALRHRDRSGQGQLIDMALLDCQVAMLSNLGHGFLASGKVPERAGNAHQNIVPYQVFQAEDGHIIAAVGNDQQFARFCAIAGIPELASDTRFATNSGRVRERHVLIPILADVMKRRKLTEWLALLETVGIPCGPINDLQKVFVDPQVVERSMTVEMSHPVAGIVRLIGSPIKMSATPVSYRRSPPSLGSDTDEVLTELGTNLEQRAALRLAGVI